MANTSNITSGLIKSLDNIDDQLDGIIKFLNDNSTFLQDLANSAGEKAQDVINDTMNNLNDRVSDKLKPLRDKLVGVLHSQYAEVQSKLTSYIAPISSFVSINWSTGEITPDIDVSDVTKLQEFAEGIIKMFVPSTAVMFVVNYATQVMPRVTSISNKIVAISTYQLEIPELPDITIPPLDIDVDPITLADITG